ncbi:MAG: hypothetical protein M3Y81_22190 [Chloroflexota bacterium]|nr:hypothetical protein [Chloroflexota bacterium]
MSPVLLMLASVIAYICGLIIITKATPYLLSHALDEGIFMGVAAADVLAGLLIFGAVVLPLALFSNGTAAVFGARFFAFVLLAGIFIVTLRMSLRSFRARIGTVPLSRILAGSYCLLLAIAALCCIPLLFQPIG